MFLAVNLLDRLLGKVSHNAGNVLANHFLLLFLLLFLAVTAVAATVLVVAVTAILALARSVTALASVIACGHSGAGIEGFLHGAAGESTATAGVAAAGRTCIRATLATAIVTVAVARAKGAGVSLGVALRASARTTVATRTATALLLLGLRDTREDSGIGLEHLGLHRGLLEFGIRRHHRRRCRSGRLRSGRRNRLGIRLGSGGLRFGLGGRRCNRLFGSSGCGSHGSRLFGSLLHGRCDNRFGCRSRFRLRRRSRGLFGGGLRRLRRSGFRDLRRRILLDRSLLEAHLHAVLRRGRGRGLGLLGRSRTRIGRSRLFQVLRAGFLLLLLFGDRRFDFLELGGIHLRDLRQDLYAIVTQELHHEVTLDPVFLGPIDRFNLFFYTHSIACL